MLYPVVATFRVTFDDSDDLIGQFQLDQLLVNETRWIILNLRPTSSSDEVIATGSSSSPTLRVKIRMEGPYRIEIAALLKTSEAYFSNIDKLSGSSQHIVQSMASLPAKFPSAKYLLVPAIPMAAFVVVASPVLLGLLALGLPFLFPLIVVLLSAVGGAVALGAGLYFSTKNGRNKIGMVVAPLITTVIRTSTGQRLMYETGDRPSPKSLFEAVLPTNDNDMASRLLVCLTIDMIGSSSYLLPIVGEAFDLTWAPIQALAVSAMFDHVMPSLKYIAFVEEILPFTDIIPSATMGWIRQYSPLLLDKAQEIVHDLTLVPQK